MSLMIQESKLDRDRYNKTNTVSFDCLNNYKKIILPWSMYT